MGKAMTQAGGIAARAASAAVLLLGAALLAAPARAQSVNDFRLPGATTTQAPPNTQGPVDPDNPVVRQPVARPTETPAPTPTPNASEAAPSLTPTTARNAPAATNRTARPAVAAPASAPATLSEAVTPATSLPTLPAETTTLPPSAGPTEPAASPTAADTGAITAYWPWIAGALALLTALFAALWWRGRSARSTQVVFEPPVVGAPEPAPALTAAAPASRPEPLLSVPPSAATGIGLSLEARRLTASLVATTLSYTIRLTNHGVEPLATLAVEGDMISAHASLPPDQQIASDELRLELRHDAVALEPGESIEFTGDFRLPLTAVTPIRAGEATYFVPLARLRVEGSTTSGSSLLMVQTFVVGEMPDDPAAALRPFRLDLGPRTFTRVGQRMVA